MMQREAPKRWEFDKADLSKWMDEQNRRADGMERKGFKTLYCVRQRVKRDLGGFEVMTVRILAHNGAYTLMKNGDPVHSARSYTDIVNWGKTAGYIDSRKIVEQVHLKRSKAPAAPAAASTKPQRAKPVESFGYYNRMTEIR